MMTEKDLKEYKGFNMDLPVIELHFGDETAYFPQTVQLNFIATGCLKDDVRYAITKEYGDSLRIRYGNNPNIEQVDAYIAEIIKEKGSYSVYNCLFYSNNISQDILEYSNFLIDSSTSEEYKFDIGEDIEKDADKDMDM